jgi:hypothetical protein
LVPDKPQFFVTSARPGNFGDHIDVKVNIDNWFDENRYRFLGLFSFFKSLITPTESITNMKLLLEELKFTVFKPFSTPDFLTSPEYTQSELLEDLMDGNDTIRTPIWRSILLSYLLRKSCKLVLFLPFS